MHRAYFEARRIKCASDGIEGVDRPHTCLVLSCLSIERRALFALLCSLIFHLVTRTDRPTLLHGTQDARVSTRDCFKRLLFLIRLGLNGSRSRAQSAVFEHVCVALLVSMHACSAKMARMTLLTIVVATERESESESESECCSYSLACSCLLACCASRVSFREKWQCQCQHVKPQGSAPLPLTTDRQTRTSFARLVCFQVESSRECKQSRSLELLVACCSLLE